MVLEENIETNEDVFMFGYENVGQSDLYGRHSVVLITK